MNIILFGPQGSGKGTQSGFIAKDFGLYQLSTGNVLREEVNNKTRIGEFAKYYMDNKFLVPDETLQEIVLIAYEKHKDEGIIFDGFPRTQPQWRLLKDSISIDAAIELSLSDDWAIARVKDRRMCPECNANYNLISLPPIVTGRCDIDGAQLMVRDDDTPEGIVKRLADYRQKTEPLRLEYAREGILHTIDGSKHIPQAHKEIYEILSKILSR